MTTKKHLSVTDLLSFHNKKVLITGAGGGIGFATAHRFAELGADLYLIDIDIRRLGLAKKSIVEEHGVEVTAFRVDLSQKGEIDKLWERLKGDEPDVLINNVGVYVFKNFLDIDEGFLDKMMQINFQSTFWMCHNFIKSRLKRKKGGVIINLGSIEAVMPFAPGLAHYDAAKTAVLGLTRALARDYSKKGFRINAVVPGGINTPGVKKLRKKAAMNFRVDMMKLAMDFKSRLPIGRFGDPDEVARVIVFLASDLASYMTGALIPVDGGFLSI